MSFEKAEPLVNARQFVAGPTSASIARLDRPYQFANLTIQTDDLLPATRAAHHDSKLLCLGSLIDPRAGRESTEAVLSRVAASSTDFLAFERAVSLWVTLVDVCSHRWPYAFISRRRGLKSAFYVRTHKVCG